MAEELGMKTKADQEPRECSFSDQNLFPVGLYMFPLSAPNAPAIVL